MTQQRIDDLQKAIETGLPIEINPKAVLEIISMLAAEKRRADMATSDIKELMASCPSDFHPCDWCEEYDNGACADRELAAGVVVCRPKWRGPCANNDPDGKTDVEHTTD